MMASLGYFVSGANSAGAGEDARAGSPASPAAALPLAPSAAADAPPIFRKCLRPTSFFLLGISVIGSPRRGFYRERHEKAKLGFRSAHADCGPGQLRVGEYLDKSRHEEHSMRDLITSQ